jgi:hypothetical protein
MSVTPSELQQMVESELRWMFNWNTGDRVTVEDRPDEDVVRVVCNIGNMTLVFLWRAPATIFPLVRPGTEEGDTIIRMKDSLEQLLRGRAS